MSFPREEGVVRLQPPDECLRFKPRVWPPHISGYRAVPVVMIETDETVLFEFGKESKESF